MNGEEIDDESRHHHMGHVLANAMMYMHFYNKNDEKSKANGFNRTLSKDDTRE